MSRAYHTIKEKRNELSIAAISLVLVGVTYWLYTRVGLVPTLIIGGSAWLALGAWLFTTYRHPVEPDRVLPLYLLLIAAELVHMAEEYLTGFPHKVSELTGATMSQDIFVVAFVMGGTILALMSAAGLFYGNPFANYYLWFVIIGPGFVNGIAHIVFPIMAGTLYFPGLATVALPVIIGIMLIVRIYRDTRSAQRTEQDGSRTSV